MPDMTNQGAPDPLFPEEGAIQPAATDKPSSAQPIEMAIPENGPATDLWVTDILCNDDTKTRTHEFTIGGKLRKFKFEAEKRLKLPIQIAHKFLAIPEGFRVERFKGKDHATGDDIFELVQSLPDRAASTGIAMVAQDIKLGECVARFDELTTTALLKRCNLLPGGEMIGPEASRQTMVQYILMAQIEARRKPRTTELTQNAETEDMDDASVKTMLEAA